MVIGDLFKIQFKQLATAILPIPHTYTHRRRKNVDKFWSILRHFGSIIILKNANNKMAQTQSNYKSTFLKGILLKYFTILRLME